MWQKDFNIFISQTRYAQQLLKKFRMDDCKPTTPIEIGLKLSINDSSKGVDANLYRQLVGSLIYLTTTRPDLSYAVSLVSRFMNSPKMVHWNDAKRILTYVKGTLNFGIKFAENDDLG